MGPAPTLDTYQAAAQSIYQPQLSSDITMAQNTEQNTVSNEEALKGQVETDYQTAINNLTSTVNSNVAKINQLYTERLGGNFSGLQGNDLGSMFSKADQQQTTIEQTRANKLTSIATTEANAENTLSNTVASLTSKYQGEEANYANSAYASAVKEYNTENYQQEELGLKQESENISAEKAAVGTTTQQKQDTIQSISSTLSKVTGKDGYISPQSYSQAKTAWVQAGYSANEFDTTFSNYRNPSNANYDVGGAYS